MTAADDDMRIDLSTLPTTTPRAAPASPVAAMAQNWSVGQLLNISIIDQLDSNTVRITINGQPLVARSAIELTPGTQLTAKVLTAGSQPQLVIQTPPAAETEPAVVSAGLGRSLPQQAPLAEVVPRMAQQLAHPASPAVLGAEVVKQLDTLLKALPNLRALAQPGTLAAAVRLAGNRLERSLGEAVARGAVGTPSAEAATPLPEGDLKLQLIGLREALLNAPRPGALTSPQRPSEGAPTAARGTTTGLATGPGTVPLAPGAETSSPVTSKAPEMALTGASVGPLGERSPGIDEGQQLQTRSTAGQTLVAPSAAALLDDVNAALARVTTHQLDSVSAAQNHALLACYEIPVKTPFGIQTLTVEVQDEGRKQVGPTPAALAVMVEVPVGNLGKLRARIGLAGERIAITTWSDTPALRDLILNHISELDTALAAKGFDVAPSVMRELAPPRAVHQGDHHLIDTQI